MGQSHALVLYSVPIELGRLGPDALDQFNRDGSTVELIGAEESLRGVAALRTAGLDIVHLHCTTLKPFGDRALEAAGAGTKD